MFNLVVTCVMVAVCQGATFTLLSDSLLNTPADSVKRTRLEGWQKEQLAKYQQRLEDRTGPGILRTSELGKYWDFSAPVAHREQALWKLGDDGADLLDSSNSRHQNFHDTLSPIEWFENISGPFTASTHPRQLKLPTLFAGDTSIQEVLAPAVSLKTAAVRNALPPVVAHGRNFLSRRNNPRENQDERHDQPLDLGIRGHAFLDNFQNIILANTPAPPNLQDFEDQALRGLLDMLCRSAKLYVSDNISLPLPPVV